MSMTIAGPNKEVKQLLGDVVCQDDTVVEFEKRHSMSSTMQNLMGELYPMIVVKTSMSMIKKPREGRVLPCQGRTGTLHCSREEFEDLFGAPQIDEPSPDNKVTFVYLFDTMKGSINVRDYWWNAENELSVSAENMEAQRIFFAELDKYNIEHS